MRYWWVNQNQTFHQEQDGGYLWSPKRKANGARNRFYDTMREVAPGDLVLSFMGTRIRAIAVVRSYCYESPKPLEFGTVGTNWSQIGWRIDVSWTKLEHQVRPATHISTLRPVLPLKYSPLRSVNGHGLQSVYLAEIPAPMMGVLAQLIGIELRVFMNARPPAEPIHVKADEVEALYTRWQDHQEHLLAKDKAVPSTERAALILSRRGQGLFRRRVSQVERACRVTKVDNAEHLIASHCKPWRHSSNEERLDGENGLLLTPSVDHLFDRGFISFKGDGRLLVSPVADKVSLERMGIPLQGRTNVGAFSEGQRSYLEYHREEIFLLTDRHKR